MNLTEARQAYYSDATFHAVVDTIAQWIFKMNVTPDEARCAAMLAAIIVEEQRVRPHFMSSLEDWEKMKGNQ